MDLKCIIITLLISYNAVDCQTLAQSKTLMSDMLTGYDKRQRPVLDQSQPIKVAVFFDLISIQDFDEVKEKFSVVGVLFMSWTDESLVWNSTDYGGIYSQMFKLDDVWYPYLIQVNPYNSVRDIGDDWMTVRITKNGWAIFTPGAVFRSTCSVDVTYYPFDTQTCELIFVPWGFSSAEMKLISHKSYVQQTLYSENGEWSLVSTKAEHMSSNGYDSIIFTFNIKRRPLFLVINIILPIIFMAVINLLVFVLPVDSGERVSYAITVLLSIAVFLTLVGENMPKTSEPMSILSYFLTFVLVISTLMCVVTIFNLNVFHKKGNKIPGWCVSITNRFTNKTTICCTRKKEVENNPVENGVVCIEQYNNGVHHTGKFDAFENGTNNDEDDTMTWKDVSVAIDRLSLMSFSLALAMIVAINLYILISNTKPGF